MSYNKIDIQRFKQCPLENEKRTPRELYLDLAHLAEMAYRFDDMCLFMGEVVRAAATGNDLTHDERNLLSVAFKNAVGARRSAWRRASFDSEKKAAPAAMCAKIEEELTDLCLAVLDLLEQVLIVHPQASQDALVFYRKMAGDYYRYLAEFGSSDLGIYQSSSIKYYKQAMELATQLMQPHDPIRLGLALNFSVGLYEIVGEKEEACRLAKKAFDDGMSRLDTYGGNQEGKDAKLILNLIRDNLSLWNQTVGKD